MGESVKSGHPKNDPAFLALSELRCMTALSPLDITIRDLTQLPNLIRVKKLMVYTCTQQWVSHESDLAGYHFHELIQTLVQRAPTIKQLDLQISQMVATLTKPAEYTLVAHSLVQTLRPIYRGPHPREADNGIYEIIAQRLEQRGDRHRIKKLLICLCQTRWETDLHQLDTIVIADLVRETHRLAPAPDLLQTAMVSIVKTLSKPAAYQTIAQSILTALAPLYQSHSPLAATPPPVPSVMTAAPPSDHQHAPLLRRKQPPDAFDLRIEIMKFTNPLRAKVLLFAALTGSIECSDRHWPVIRTRELDDLLNTLLQTASSYDELEQHLLAIAQGSSESSAYLQTASAVLKAASSYYLANPQSRFGRSQPRSTDHQTQANMGAATQPLSPHQAENSAADEPDQSCQLEVKSQPAATSIASGLASGPPIVPRPHTESDDPIRTTTTSLHPAHSSDPLDPEALTSPVLNPSGL